MSAKHLPPIVAFAGWPGAGKNTAAQALVAIGYREDSFAGPLKAMALDINPIVTVQYGSPVWLSDLLGRESWERAKREPGTLRFLQDLGKAVRDNLGNQVLVDALADRRQCTQANPDRTVITDCEDSNEATWVKRQHFTRWPLVEPGVLIWLDRDGCHPPNDHDSGVCRELLADHIVSNNGTVEELHAEVLRVLGLEVAR